MSGSLILRASTNVLVTLFLIFSFFLLWRGHNEPGGGFAGGLVAAAGFSLFTIAFGPRAARQSMRLDPRMLIGLGMLIALGSLLSAFFAGENFGTGLWIEPTIAGSTVKLGTPLLFDIGVYLVVVGTATALVFALAEEED